MHAGWTLVQPIRCNCEAKTELTVLLGPNLPPCVCPSCLNVYGVVFMHFNPAKNIAPTIGVGVIGRATVNTPEDDMQKKLAAVKESLN